MYGYIYETICKINNKKYIGKHQSEVFDNSYLGSGVLLKRAIELYGEENFEVKLLVECANLNELNEQEKYYIHLNNAQESGDFYNIAAGGDGGILWSSKSEHPSTRRNLKGENNPFYGKTHSEKTKQYISQLNKGKPNTAVKGKIRIHKDDLIKYIFPNELNDYIELGWYKIPPREKKGTRKGWHQSEYQKKRASETHKGKTVSKETIEKYKHTIKNRTEEKQALISKHCSDSQKNLRWVVKPGEKALRIHKDDLENYLLNGYIQGRKIK